MRNFGSTTLIIYALMLLFSASRCSEKNETKTAFTSTERPKMIKKAVLEKIEYEEIGYPQTYDTLRALHLNEITKEFFESAVTADMYQEWSKGFRENKRHLIFETQNFFVKLKKRKKNYEKAWWYEFLGFNDKLNAYIYTENSVAEGLNFGTLCFLDSLSNKAYQIVSISDVSVEHLILSENGMFMAYFNNEMVGNKSTFIGILKVDTTRHEKKYVTELCSFQDDSFYIEDMRWLGDSMLVLNTVEFDEKRTYYEAKLP